MDELKILFWIVIALVYIFSRRKKKPQAPAPSSRQAEVQEPVETQVPDQPVTFEELLREIQGMKKPEPAPSPSQVSDRPPVKRDWENKPYEVEEIEGEKELEDTNYDYRKQDKIYDVYEDARKDAFLRPSLEETIKLKDTVVRFDQFKEYEIEARHNFGVGILKELKDPKGFKKAFIMSEILKKRF